METASPQDAPSSPRLSLPLRGAFSAQMLQPPSASLNSMDKTSREHHENVRNDDAFAKTLRRETSSPRPHHAKPSIRQLLTRKTSVSPCHSSPRASWGNVKKPKQMKAQTLDNPTPCGRHPIETLAKKLRHQATELTQVYEKLATQNVQLDAAKEQITDLKLQLEQVRAQHRTAVDRTVKKATASRLEQQKRAAQMMSGTPSTGASLGQKRDELDRKLKEVEDERQKYHVATKRLEMALVELQVFQTDRREKLDKSSKGGLEQQDDDELDAVVKEQGAYIRVLEEAVHVKATDLELTGHEELLVVLAELRQRLYQGEQTIEEKSNLVSCVQEKLEHEQEQHASTKRLFGTAQTQHDDVVKEFQEQEAALRSQLIAVEKELDERTDHLKQLHEVSSEAQRREETLKAQVTAATKAHNVMETKLKDATQSLKAVEEELDGTLTKHAEATEQLDELREECRKKEAHLDELKALQEELLESVDKYANEAKRERDKVERLEAQVEAYKGKEESSRKEAEDGAKSLKERLAVLQENAVDLEKDKQQVKAQCSALEQEVHRLEKSLRKVQGDLQEEIHQSIHHQEERTTLEQRQRQMEEAVAQVEAALSTALLMMSQKPLNNSEYEAETAEDEMASTDAQSFLLDHLVLRELQTCGQALKTLSVATASGCCALVCPSFREVLVQVAAIGDKVFNEVTRALVSWTKERTNLLEACAMLDATAQTCRNEMEKRQDDTRELQVKMTERTLEIETYAMQVDKLNEQLRDAEAKHKTFQALEQLVVNQENALETKEEFVRHLSVENDRLEAIERALSIQVATNARNVEQLDAQHAMMKDQKEYTDELECTLENAANLAEQQNECNHQLNTQLEQMTVSQREQANDLKMLEIHTSAFVSHVQDVGKQCVHLFRPLASTDRSLHQHLEALEVQLKTGNNLRLLSLVLVLIKAHISTCSTRGDHRVAKGTKERQRNDIPPTKQKLKNYHRDAVMATNTWLTDPHDVSSSSTTFGGSKPLEFSIPIKSKDSSADVDKEGNNQLDQQLEFLRRAFEKYKEDVRGQMRSKPRH